MRDTKLCRLVWAVVVVTALHAGCEAAPETASEPKAAPPQPLRAAGASFPAPLYQRWMDAVAGDGPPLRYESVGSVEGVRRFLDGQSDIAGTETGLTVAERVAVSDNVLPLPLIAGHVALAYNLPGYDDLRLSREAYVAIFREEVERWDDPLIAEANPGVSLPATPLQTVHRADGSGTTFVFTHHLSKASALWDQEIGWDKEVQWPGGEARPQNSGVAKYIRETEGSIGYVSFPVAKRHALQLAKLENKAGHFVGPDLASAQAAFEGLALADLSLLTPDPSHPRAYPIVTFTWLLTKRSYDNPEVAATVRKLVLYGLSPEGQALAAELDYVPLPPEALKRVREAAESISAQQPVASASP